jgi:hypothetical protein
MVKPYFYIVMSQKELLKNQVIEEILRERTNYYLSKNKPKDFWLLIGPKFIEKSPIKEKIQLTNFYKQQFDSIAPLKDNREFYAALISTNVEFINWIKLRLGDFEDLDQKILSTSSFRSDGVFGKLILNTENILESSPNYLHPDIYVDQYKDTLELYYQNFP